MEIPFWATEDWLVQSYFSLQPLQIVTAVNQFMKQDLWAPPCTGRLGQWWRHDFHLLYGVIPMLVPHFLPTHFHSPYSLTVITSHACSFHSVTQLIHITASVELLLCLKLVGWDPTVVDWNWHLSRQDAWRAEQVDDTQRCDSTLLLFPWACWLPTAHCWFPFIN